MTQLLEKAFHEARKLPDDVQNALARHILDGLRSEWCWTEAFDRTTNEQWDTMAERVRGEIASGEIDPLTDLQP